MKYIKGVMMILSPQELKQLEKEHFIEVPYKDKEFVVMGKKELQRAKKLDLLYLDFLQSQAKGNIITIKSDEELEKHLKELEKCIN